MKRNLTLLSTACFAWLVASIPAQASTVFNIQLATASAGSTGNSFDVTLTNTGPGAIDIGGFSFGFSTADTHIVYTGVTTATTLAPYIFAGDSLFGPIIDTTSGAQTIVASDLCTLCTGNNIIASGGIVGLGHVFFNVLPAATGIISESFISSDNSLSTPGGANIVVNTANNGSITITTTVTTPEPSTWLLFGLGLVPALIARKSFRRS